LTLNLPTYGEAKGLPLLVMMDLRLAPKHRRSIPEFTTHAIYFIIKIMNRLLLAQAELLPMVRYDLADFSNSELSEAEELEAPGNFMSPIYHTLGHDLLELTKLSQASRIKNDAGEVTPH
jgi:hypothetical protein